MPRYEYHCEHCDKTFEQVHPVDDRDNGVCEECGKPAKRLLASFVAQFKGSGFHKNDYSSNGAKPASGASCPTGSCCSGGSCPF